MTAGQDEVGSSFGQCAREVLAEAAAGSGDEGHVAGKIEESFIGGVAHGCSIRCENHLHQFGSRA